LSLPPHLPILTALDSGKSTNPISPSITRDPRPLTYHR
jgi:hypothetical protein